MDYALVLPVSLNFNQSDNWSAQDDCHAGHQARNPPANPPGGAAAMIANQWEDPHLHPHALEKGSEQAPSPLPLTITSFWAVVR